MNDFLKDIKVELLSYFSAVIDITPKLFIAIFILLLTLIIARQIKIISDKALKKRMEDPLLANFLSTVIKYLIFLFGILLAFKVLGLGGVVTSILAGAGISAFIIGFALRDIGENFLAGILMAFKRPFRVGDFIETGSIKGKVIALSIRDTQIKTIDGKDVYIPNSNIIKNPLINYTIDGFLRFDILLNLDDKYDNNLLMEKIYNAVAKVEGVLENDRKPDINISSIEYGKIELLLSYWIDTFSSKVSSEKIKSDVNISIKKIIKDIKEL